MMVREALKICIQGNIINKTHNQAIKSDARTSRGLWQR